ncbi:hypothetical protein HDU89_001140 [Geranomyces variabilis]|nr:hypothetical protein HDU89_001140 [Geranomyces variabilis]
MILWWGKERTIIYNQAYIPIFGSRHPTVLGTCACDAWKEVWDVIGPMMKEVDEGGVTFSEDQMLEVTRSGYVEEAYFTYSFSPVPSPDGSVAGIITPIQETTSRILSQRRLTMIATLSQQMGKMYSAQGALHIASQIFASQCADVPVSGVYLLHKGSDKLTLEGRSGLFPSDPSLPAEVIPGDPVAEALWPFAAALSSSDMIEVEVGDLWNGASGGIWPERPHTAVVLAIRLSEAEDPLGLLVMGINPRKKLDAAYREFCDGLRKQLAIGILNAKAYEEEQRRAEALAALDLAKTKYIANISHELRTPLTLLRLPISALLEDDTLSPETRAQVQLMDRATLRLMKLVNTVLDFSRLLSGKGIAQYVLTNIASLTRDITSMFRSAIEAGGLQLAIDIPDDIGNLMMYLDLDHYEKILSNLLSNSYKFTLQGSITVSLQWANDTKDELGRSDFVSLSVTDTGCGIGASDLPRLFERFYIVENTASRSHEGTGIGLALTMELVTLHGGTCVATSELGVGTTITIQLPIDTSRVPPAAYSRESSDLQMSRNNSHSSVVAGFLAEVSTWAENSRAPWQVPLPPKEIAPLSVPTLEPERTDPYHVLVADDNSDVRNYLSKLLRDRYQVTITVDGQQAYDEAVRHPPDIIVSDCIMPNVGGFELITKIRANKDLQYTPVILLSVRAGEEARLEGLVKANADDYLVKPFSAKELLARVQTHLEIGHLRKKLVKELRAKESEFQIMCSMAPVGIVRADEEGRLIFANGYWANLAGQDHKQDPATWGDHVHPDDRSRVRAEFDLHNGETKSGYSVEYRLVTPGGAVKHVVAHCVPSCQPGRPVEWFIGTLDVSERESLYRERLAMRLHEIETERERANEADEHRKHVEAFTDMVCHEVRNPLNSVLQSADLLREAAEKRIALEASNPNVASSSALDLELIKAIHMCAQHQKVIVDDVLSLSKLHGSRIILSPIWSDPGQILSRMVTMFFADALRQGIRLESALENSVGDQSDEVFVDVDRVVQIAFNLLSNAMKFVVRSEKREVKIILTVGPAVSEDRPPAEENGAYYCELMLTVRDTGIGMTDEEQVALFQRFSQASPKTYREYGGSGLGLFICKEMIELMNGDISVTSAKGRGTEFKARTTCLRRPWKKPVTSEPASSRADGSSKSQSTPDPLPADMRIMIVEDNLVNQKVLSRQLKIAGFPYAVANNGAEAVAMFSETENGETAFDCILMDVEMPVMNGLDATKWIRQLERDRALLARAQKASSSQPTLKTGVLRPPNYMLPILGLSGNARDESRIQALEAGMSAYMVKPYDRKTLFEMITKSVVQARCVAPTI